jgi:uncharacterized protein (TIGR02231 family)
MKWVIRYLKIKKLRASLLVFLVVAVGARADEIEVDSRIVAATVYPNRATVTREAVVDLPAGSSVMVFHGLPAHLLTDSLRIEGQAAGTVTFGALMHRLESQAELVAPKEQELVARIERLKDQRREIEAERQGLSAQRQFLEHLGDQAGNRISEEIAELRLAPEEWSQAALAIGSSMQTLLKADLAHQIAIRDLDRTVKSLETELSQLHTGRRNTYAVQIPLAADQPTSLTVHLRYQLPGVSWRPLYDARLDTKTGELSLIQYGAVRQNSGEEWHAIRLVLSTAQPHRGASMPGLKPLWVDLYEPGRRERAEEREITRLAAPQKSLKMSADALSGAGSANLEEAEFAGPEMQTDGFVTEYAIPGQVRVASDGTESKLMCGSFSTDNRLQIQIKPQVSNEAFVVSHATLAGEAILLPGKASLFRDGAYVGQLELPLLRPGQAQEIGFGVDDRIAVTRNVLKDVRSDPTLLSRNNQRERQVATVIMNQGTAAVDVIVLETIPVARHDDIEVKILEDQTTKGYEQDVDDIKGLLRWQIPLASGGQTRLTLGWQVSWPKDREISGL